MKSHQKHSICDGMSPARAVGECFGNRELSHIEDRIKKLHNPTLDGEGGGGGEELRVTTP